MNSCLCDELTSTTVRIKNNQKMNIKSGAIEVFPRRRVGARSNIPLAIISLSHGTNHLLQLILPTLLPSLITEFQISHSTAGMLVASFALPYAILQIPFGYLSDRKRRKRTMVFGLFLYSFATFLCGLSQNTLQLALTQFLAGMGGASYHPVGIPLVSFVVSRKRLGQAQGFHQAGGAIGSFIAPILSAYIGTAFNWRYSFILLSLFGLVNALVVCLGIAEPSPTYREEDEDAKTIPFDSKLTRLIVLLFCFGLVEVITFRGLLSFLTTYATEKHAIGLESAAQLLALLQIAGIFGSPLFGRLSDAIGRKITLAILMVCQSAIMYSLTYASLEVLAILLGAMGLAAFGTLAVSDGWLTGMNLGAIVGTIIGSVTTASFLAGAVVTPIVGFLADQFGFDFSFRVLAITGLLGLPILKIIKDT